MNRRDFLKITSALLATSAIASPLRAQGASRNFGLQLFTVREHLKNAPVQTLERVASIGFKEVELFGFGGNIFVQDPLQGLSAKEFRQALDDCGLTLPTTTVAGDLEVHTVAEVAQELGIRYLTIGMAPEFGSSVDGRFVVSAATSIDQLQRIAERLNKQGLQCKENGFRLAYHNHHMEFVPLAELSDTLPFDYLMQLTDPDLVKIELDVGWLTVAQVDPLEYLRRYGDRVIAVHLKDFNPALPIGQDLKTYPIPVMAQLVEPGAGVVDFKRVLEVTDEIGLAHRFIEIDVAPSPFDAARNGLEFLRNLGA